ncbi:hypothetical protein [Frankia sp. ACN1ag]|uniref:hypothetical protein n=1 Tax=Frankia sp. ACN1ag TaxID=102891 RepID=UPI0006DC79F8|nr:hypothetical protein [Frankia sp. ACN1ag]KQC35768.1 hypothetical protein UK82_24895 [Frankia sp. ACN1ag]
MTAHALLLDPAGRVLLVRTTAGAWALPSTVLTFQVSPYRQIVRMAHDVLGIEVAERDLLLAHVSAHRDTTHAGLGLIISIGHWQGHPVPSDVRSGGSTGRRWCAPGEPPQPLAAWDANALTAILGNSTYAEIGWQPRPATGIARPSR